MHSSIGAAMDMVCGPQVANVDQRQQKQRKQQKQTVDVESERMIKRYYLSSSHLSVRIFFFWCCCGCCAVGAPYSTVLRSPPLWTQKKNKISHRKLIFLTENAKIQKWNYFIKRSKKAEMSMRKNRQFFVCVPAKLRHRHNPIQTRCLRIRLCHQRWFVPFWLDVGTRRKEDTEKNWKKIKQNGKMGLIAKCGLI